jgi:hypothetical protein
MQVTTESLKWIVAAMKSNQMAATTPTPDVSIMKKKQEGKYYNVKLLYQKGDCSYPRYQHYEEKTGKYR